MKHIPSLFRDIVTLISFTAYFSKKRPHGSNATLVKLSLLKLTPPPLCAGDSQKWEWHHRVRLQVLCDGGGRDGLQGHAHEAQGQAEEDRCQEDRVAGGELE